MNLLVNASICFGVRLVALQEKMCIHKSLAHVLTSLRLMLSIQVVQLERRLVSPLKMVLKLPLKDLKTGEFVQEMTTGLRVIATQLECGTN